MTIASAIDELLNHPHWKNEHERRLYLIDLCTYIYMQTCEEAAVAYRNNRRFTPAECFTAIKNMPPPNLSHFIKFHDPECIIIQIEPEGLLNHSG